MVFMQMTCHYFGAVIKQSFLGEHKVMETLSHSLLVLSCFTVYETIIKQQNIKCLRGVYSPVLLSHVQCQNSTGGFH